jgi:hypothetical protein
MTFRNAASDAGVATGPAEYRVSWAAYDNATGMTIPVGQVERCARAECPLPAKVTADTQYLRAEIRTIHPAYPAWNTPVRVFLRRDHESRWTAVGLERLPEPDRRVRSNNAGE